MNPGLAPGFLFGFFVMHAVVFDAVLSAVMAGLVPAIRVFPRRMRAKAWMPATSAGMTVERDETGLNPWPHLILSFAGAAATKATKLPRLVVK